MTSEPQLQGYRTPCLESSLVSWLLECRCRSLPSPPELKLPRERFSLAVVSEFLSSSARLSVSLSSPPEARCPEFLSVKTSSFSSAAAHQLESFRNIFRTLKFLFRLNRRVGIRLFRETIGHFSCLLSIKGRLRFGERERASEWRTKAAVWETW